MVSKRQFSRMAGIAEREVLAMSPDALAESRKTWRKLCLDTLRELALEVSDSEARDYSARATKMIRLRCDRLLKTRSDLDREIRVNLEWEAYSAELKESLAQDKRLYEQLPQFIWEKATECVSDGVSAAIAWIEVGGYELLRPAVDHMIAIGTANKFRNPIKLKGNMSSGKYSADFWRSLIRASGGAKYFLYYAVAVAMADQFMAVSDVVQGRGTDLDPFETPPFLDILRSPCVLWTNRYQPLAIALAFLPEEHRKQFVASIAANRQSMQDSFDEAQRKRSGMERQSCLLEKEAATLRKRLNTAQDQNVQLQAGNQALLESLRSTASKTAAYVASTEHARELDGYVTALREKDTRLGRLQNSLGETAEQLALTRELVTILLEPSPDVSLVHDHLDVDPEPEKWRIVFVGGHERLHSKLRKHMRNAVFLHPDQSHFSPETFKGADAVVFSIGYCSHALTYRAADEVRRRGLRAGYSNFTNVEMVLDEVRAILFQGAERRDQKAA